MIRKIVWDIPKMYTIELRPWDAEEVLAGEESLLPLVQRREPRPQLLDLGCNSIDIWNLGLELGRKLRQGLWTP